MKIYPSNNLFLFGYNNFFLNLVKLHNSSCLPNKIIFSGLKGIGKATFAYHLTNYIFSKKEGNIYNLKDNRISEENYSYKLLAKNCHPNFFSINIDAEKNKSQINNVREMINFINKSSFNNEKKIILIDNIELLNINSINALLKIIEEPNKNLYFFLIHNTNKKILDTISSRCIKFRMSLHYKDKLTVVNNLLNNDFYSDLSEDFKSIYDTPGQILELYNFFKEENIDIHISIEKFINLIIEKSAFKKNIFIKKNLGIFIELFFKKKISNYKAKDKLYDFYKIFLHKVNECNKYNLDIDNILIEFKAKILNG